MIEAFIFDWSGVISDDRKPVYEANMMLLKYYGRDKISFDEWFSNTGSHPHDFLVNFGIENLDRDEVFERYTECFQQVIANGTKPFMYPGVPDVLRFLEGSGKCLSVLSSHPEDNLRGEMKEYEIDGFFEVVRGSSSNKAESLGEICDEIRLWGEDVLYTGDTFSDMRAAKRAGIGCAAVLTGYHTEEVLRAEEPDYVFEDLGGLMGLVGVY